MNEQTNQPENHPDSHDQNAPAPAKKSRRKWWIGGGVAVVALGALAATGASFADGGFSRAHWRGHDHGMSRSFDPARMGKKVDFGVDLILGRVGADEKQKTKVASTIKGVLGQVPAFRQGHIDARDQLSNAERMKPRVRECRVFCERTAQNFGADAGQPPLLLRGIVQRDGCGG